MSARHLDRRRLLAAGAGLALAVAASSARAAEFGANGRMLIAVYKDFAPWSWRKDGAMTGIDVELGAKLAERLGLRADYFELMSDENVEDDLRNAVWRGSVLGSPLCDIMLHVPTDKAFAAEQTKVAIGVPYFRDSFRLACAEANACAQGAMGLEGRKLGVELDSAPDYYLLSVMGGKLRSNVKHFPQGAEAAQAVARGDLDAVLATRAQVEYGLAGKPSAKHGYDGPFPGMGRTSWEVGLAVRTDNAPQLPKLQAAMSAVIASGELAAICARYGVTFAPPEASA